MKLYIVRHGQSEANVNPEVYRDVMDHNICLTPTGVDQSLAAGLKLKNLIKPENTHVFVSPYKRTQQTWEHISKNLHQSDLFKVILSPIIREQEYKIFADMADMQAKKEEREIFGAFWYRFKNAESTADVYARILTFINHLMALSAVKKIKKNDNVVVITHEVVIRMFLMVLNSLPPEKAKVDIQNAEIICIEISDNWEVTSQSKI